MDIREQIGLKIRSLRKEQGFSQEEFARYCQIHRSYMGNIERGETNISVLTIEKIALALDVPITTLFEF